MIELFKPDMYVKDMVKYAMSFYKKDCTKYTNKNNNMYKKEQT